MKKFYQGTLFVALMLAAIYGCGTAEEGGSLFVWFLAMLAIAALMYKADMFAKPISKEKYDKIYNR